MGEPRDIHGSSWMGKREPAASMVARWSLLRILARYRKAERLQRRTGDSGARDDIWGTDSGFREVSMNGTSLGEGINVTLWSLMISGLYPQGNRPKDHLAWWGKPFIQTVANPYFPIRRAL